MKRNFYILFFVTYVFYRKQDEDVPLAGVVFGFFALLAFWVLSLINIMFFIGFDVLLHLNFIFERRFIFALVCLFLGGLSFVYMNYYVKPFVLEELDGEYGIENYRIYRMPVLIFYAVSCLLAVFTSYVRAQTW